MCEHCRYNYYRQSNKLCVNHPQDYTIYSNKLLELNSNNTNTLQEIILYAQGGLIDLQEFIDSLPSFTSTFPNLKFVSLYINFFNEDDVQRIQQLSKLMSQLKSSLQLHINIEISQKLSKQSDLLVNLKQLSNLSNTVIYLDQKLTRKVLFSFTSYDDVTNYFDELLENLPNNIKILFFNPAKYTAQGANNPGLYWDDYDGERYSQLLFWADEWRQKNNNSQIIWPNLKSKCDVTDYNGTIAISPTGELSLCHRGIWEGTWFTDETIVEILDTNKFASYLIAQYDMYKNNMSLSDFKESIPIYINLNWCPYLYSFGPQMPQALWFSNEIPLLYNGAMNILLKWSREK